MLHSALIHGTLPTKKKGFVKYVMVERFNPLKKIPIYKIQKIQSKYHISVLIIIKFQTNYIH